MASDCVGPGRQPHGSHPMQDVLSTAVALHQAGRLGSAAPLYRKVLTGEPERRRRPLFGVLHHPQGHHARAVELIGRARSCSRTCRPFTPTSPRLTVVRAAI